MFEEDADYRKARKESKDRITKVIKAWSAREETLHNEGFQKGAEFGYNKAFVEADKNLKAVVADFNKANEWHYVKDGFPTKDGRYLICNIFSDNYVATNIAEFNSRTGIFGCIDNTTIYAWKEIVPPEEIKENDLWILELTYSKRQ